jgi:acyl carrier protein
LATVTAAEAYEFVRSELLDFGVDPEDVHGGAKLDQLDIDSLDAAELMTSVKRKFGVQIPRSELVDRSLDDLVRRIVSAVQPA